MQICGRGAANNIGDALLLPVRNRRIHAEARKRFIIRDAFQGGGRRVYEEGISTVSA